MRAYETDGRRWARVLTLAALATVLVLLTCGGPARAAAFEPDWLWSVETQSDLAIHQIAHGGQQGGRLKQAAVLGPAAFDFHPATVVSGKAVGRVLGTADGRHYSVLAQAPTADPVDPASRHAGLTHFDVYQAYQKEHGQASLRITLSRVLLDGINQNAESVNLRACPGSPGGDLSCAPFDASVFFNARVYSAKGDLFDAGGDAQLGGLSFHRWLGDAGTSSDSEVPAWTNDSFTVADTGSEGKMQLKRPLTFKVPLSSVDDGDFFTVHVSLEADAIDQAGFESAVEAFIKDPQGTDPPLLQAHGLKPRGHPILKEPPLRPLPAARCPGGPHRGAGIIQFGARAFFTSEGGLGKALVSVTRTGGSHGAASVNVSTSGGSAQTGGDFKSTSTRVRWGDGDAAPRLVEIPIREDQAIESLEQFKVSLAHARCAKLGKQDRAPVTIVDDDQPPVPPPPAFTVGGTVDGLEGSGLVLVNQTTDLPVAANGPFTFPGTLPPGSSYDVRVQVQPTHPDQVCSVVGGAGTVTADVSNVAIHCANVVTPTGLDTSFGLGGRVSTPGGGDARAVLVRPDGRIIVVGRRDVGANFHFQFGAAGYDGAGNLDPGFGTAGIATTGLGGSDDEAFDAADDRDGGFVAVGRTNAAGPTNTDFGVARYTAAGQPNPAFPAGGFVRTDVAGRADGADAVAVQPDGKIVAAGFAQTSPIDFDFALLRYNPDGTLDRSFGGDGIVTTDIGDLNDSVNGVAIQPDGKIVAVGATGENVALARYLPDGSLDQTFGGSGTVVSDLGFDDVANGVAITSGGTILIAGTRLGPHVNLDPYVASYGPNGRLNLGFGQSGVADTDLSGGDDFGDDLVLDPGGGIVVVGYTGSPTVTDMALVRYRLDGTLDTFLTTDFHGAGDFGHALAVDPHGAIVAAGTIANGSENEFGLIRAFF
jgi:uncharacterized delta-60 repeat protein